MVCRDNQVILTLVYHDVQVIVTLVYHDVQVIVILVDHDVQVIVTLVFHDVQVIATLVYHDDQVILFCDGLVVFVIVILIYDPVLNDDVYDLVCESVVCHGDQESDYEGVPSLQEYVFSCCLVYVICDDCQDLTTSCDCQVSWSGDDDYQESEICDLWVYPVFWRNENVAEVIDHDYLMSETVYSDYGNCLESEVDQEEEADCQHHFVPHKILDSCSYGKLHPYPMSAHDYYDVCGNLVSDFYFSAVWL